MGQKVHPESIRVGYIHDWKSNWFNERNFSDFLHEDTLIRQHIIGRLSHAGLSDITIRKNATEVEINIHTARPGIVIGKSGSEVDQLRRDLHRITGKQVKVNILEIKRPELDARLVAQSIAEQLQNRVAFRRAMKRALTSAMRSGAKGVKVQVSGRLGGAEMARTEGYSDGRVPLHTLRADIDYGFHEARTTFGRIGVKCWINKGEIMPEGYTGADLTIMDEPAPQAPERGGRDGRDGRGRGRRGDGGPGVAVAAVAVAAVDPAVAVRVVPAAVAVAAVAPAVVAVRVVPVAAVAVAVRVVRAAVVVPVAVAAAVAVGGRVVPVAAVARARRSGRRSWSGGGGGGGRGPGGGGGGRGPGGPRRRSWSRWWRRRWSRSWWRRRWSRSRRWWRRRWPWSARRWRRRYRRWRRRRPGWCPLMLAPKRVKHRKQHRGRRAGLSRGQVKVQFGEYGLKSLEAGWLTNRQIEAARIAMTRKIKRGGKVWINVYPDKPFTKKPAETRMGSGKGSPEGWVAVVKPGRVMFELAGVPEPLAREAMRLAGHKLPVRTKFVMREDG